MADHHFPRGIPHRAIRHVIRGVAATFQRLGVPTIGDAPDYLVPEERMFDSMYHADSVGARKVSETLSKDLCKKLTCPLSP